jgi:hypothetical protein
MKAYRFPMEKLTKFAIAHMRKLANATIDDTNWKYAVALKSKQAMQGYAILSCIVLDFFLHVLV